MNWPLVSRMLGYLSLLVGGAMVVSVPWSFPICGQTHVLEQQTLIGLAESIGISLAVGLVLLFLGRSGRDTLLRKEALAVVGLGWMLSGLLGDSHSF